MTTYFELYHGYYVHSENLFEYNRGDQILKHRLWGPKFGFRFKKSTRNAPQHATRGTHFEIHLYRIISKHNLAINIPYTLKEGYQILNSKKDNHYSWNYAKLDFEKYIHFNHFKPLTLGFKLEAVYFSKKNFKSKLVVKETGEELDIDLYPLDILTSPQFFPFWNSERFLSTFHTASSYIAMGLDPIFHLTKKLQLRFPFYIYNYFFENSTSATNTENLKINPNFFSKYFISNGIHLVYETALLPISIGINRYDALVYEKEEYNFFFKIGLSLDNKMQLK